MEEQDTFFVAGRSLTRTLPELEELYRRMLEQGYLSFSDYYLKVSKEDLPIEDEPNDYDKWA